MLKALNDLGLGFEYAHYKRTGRAEVHVCITTLYIAHFYSLMTIGMAFPYTLYKLIIKLLNTSKKR